MGRFLAFFVASISLLVSVRACWEQCGGQGWTGSTTCPGDCVCTFQNQWYSQCLPPTATTSTSSKTTTSSPRTSSTTTPNSPRYWFSFGDSYTSTGFSITGTKPNAANVFGNPTYPGYTTCGLVTNWIDEMIVSYNESVIYTYNFAYGGATIDANLVAPYASTVKSMTDQVNEFLNNVGSKPSYAPWTSSTAVFSFFIGINDIGGSFLSGGDRSAFSDTLLNAYFALVQKIYDVGGRNFLFINVPPVERSPREIGRGTSTVALEKSVIDTYNSKLSTKISSFKASHSGAATWLYNSNTKLVQILNSPTSYGFKDATSYGSASNLAWCDNYHVSPGVHHLWAVDIKALLANTGF